jgi:hypothetical protein
VLPNFLTAAVIVAQVVTAGLVSVSEQVSFATESRSEVMVFADRSAASVMSVGFAVVVGPKA